jgi:hypothetical protein
MPRNLLLAAGLIFVVVLIGVPTFGQERTTKPNAVVPVPATKIDFDRQVRPILSNTCFTCHGPDEANRKARLRLDSKAGAFAERRGGYHIIVPGDLAKSELYKRISSSDPAERMPPPRAHKQLKREDAELLRRWIEQGAPWEEHWAFVPPRRPSLPKVKNTQWPINGLDYFVLARLEREGLQPAALASREKLLRRVTLDLTGLPPTLEEIDAFLSDNSPGAYERVVDRLLASPRYGEHMALAWLDAARYADTNGYQGDGTRTMWPWRDWLVNTLNRNMPFDEFTIEMLAGDLLPGATIEQKLATGFHRNHMLNGEGGRNAEESRVEYVVDRVETTATVWLGLTMGCGRCHNHKYDPLSQKDFYRFYAFFDNVPESGGVDRRGNANPVIQLPAPDQVARRDQLKKEASAQQAQLNTVAGPAALARWERRTRAASRSPANIQTILKIEPSKRSKPQQDELRKYFRQTVPEGKALQTKIDQTQKTLTALNNSILEVMVMDERPVPRETYALQRGQWDKPDKSERLFPGVPSVLPPLPQGVPANRLALARWLVAPEHPLTARVTVNRYWQQFFGTGLVKTMGDFGSQGERPSHPELLDWLAVEFRASGWNVKRLHRLIVTSATYRQSSQVTPERLEKDPYNRLLSRGPRVRLTSLALRDQALAVSGLLVEKRGGPAVKPYQPPGVWEDFSLGQIRYTPDKAEGLHRRSLYTFWRRSVGPTMFFDAPARQVCTVNQARTNTPLHALTLMNDITYVEAARALGQRMLHSSAHTQVERLALGFRLVAGRRPSAREQETLLQLYGKLLGRYQQDPKAAQQLLAVGESPRDESLDVVELAAYTGVANLLLNLDEVMTKE